MIVMAVSRTVSPFEMADDDMAMFMTSAPRRLPAISNELCVRVEASKKRLTWVCPCKMELRMPLVVSLILIGFFIWLAENFGTFFGLWAYPHQIGAWATVHVSKWSAWTLLVLMSFTIVANLKHIKATIHVPQ